MEFKQWICISNDSRRYQDPPPRKSLRRNASSTASKVEDPDNQVSSITNGLSKYQKTNNKSSPAKDPSTVNASYLIKYQPKCKSDLCIDKKKLSILEEWFQYIYQPVIDDKRQVTTSNRILVLYGPTGCGKTSTVFCLAKHHDVKLYEFEEKTQTFGQSADEREYTQQVGKQLDQIQTFVTNANSSISKKDRLQRKAIILKDLPSTFLTKIDQFHEFIRNYLTLFRKGAPIIFIITMDDKMNSTVFKKLFPTESQIELGFYFVELNGVAKKQIRIALERMNLTGQVSKQDIEMLIESSNGDIRSAINAFEFIVESDKNMNNSFEFQKNKCNIVMAIKDTSPTFFHMLGKIMYCKRDGDDTVTSKKKQHSQELMDTGADLFDDTFDIGSNYFISIERRKLKENPEKLVDQVDSSGDTLSLFIHECYLDFVDDNLNSAANIIANLCFIDSYFTEDKWQNNEIDEYAKLLAVRGTMFNLNTTAEPVTKRKRNFKQFNKPNYYSILKEEEKFRFKIDELCIKSTVDTFRSRDEQTEIMYYRNRNVFAKLLR